MQSPRALRGIGLAFLSCGLTFLLVAVLAGQNAFYGVGTAFLTLGVVFIATSAKKRE